MLQKYNPKNDDIYIYIDGELHQRKNAKISVFDSSVQGGDAVWEGLRVYNRGIFCLDSHLDRLFSSAKALAFQGIPSREHILKALTMTLKKNGMYRDSHIRLTLTRGIKYTSGMDPRLNDQGCSMIVLAEWKAPVYDNATGIRVITSAVRRNSPQFLDSKIHHANLLNNIQAKIQANFAGVDAAIMLDHNGFISELNDTNLFMIRDKKLFTPKADSCLPGITRGLVIQLAETLNIPVIEKNISLTEFYHADEVFATGTMGELTPVIQIDGRDIENHTQAGILDKLNTAFYRIIPEYCTVLDY